MSQLNEKWASLTQDERDEMEEKDRKGRIKSLAMKYGRRRVDAAQKEVETDAKRTGRNTKKRPITWRELQGRIENSSKLKRGEVRKWDKEKGKWVSNKEDVNEEPNWNDGVNVRWNIGPNKKEVSLNLNGTTLASKKSEKWTGKTKPKSAVNKALIDLKNTQDPARNLPGMKSEEKSLKDLPGLGGGGGGTNSITEKSKRKKNIFKTYKPTQRDLDQEK